MVTTLTHTAVTHSGIDVVTLGETMACLRGAGPLRLGGAMTLSVAGAESNVAIGLARLGHRVRWAGVVGADELGELVLRTLRAEAVDVGAVRVDPAAPTGLLIQEHRVANVSRVHYYRAGSAGSRLRPGDAESALDGQAVPSEPPGPAVPSEPPGPAVPSEPPGPSAPTVPAARSKPPAAGIGPRFLHVTGITPALSPDPRAAVDWAVRRARELSARVCLDVNYRARLWDRERAAAVLTGLVPYVDVLVASDDELPLVADGERDEERAVRRLLEAGVGEVVVKYGAAGARAWSAAGQTRSPARRVPVAGTVGAGDAFVAGYLSGAMDGLPVEERLDRAAATAAFAVAAPGDWEGMPDRAELAMLDGSDGATIR